MLIMTDRDLLICQAFYEIVSTPTTELEKRLGNQIQFTIATYLNKLPFEDRYDDSAMAKHIGNYCYQPGNEKLKEWIKDIYKASAGEDLKKGIEKNKDPGDEADRPTKIARMLNQKSRDILQDLERWSDEVLRQHNNQNNRDESNQN